VTVVSSLNSLLEDEQEALQWIQQQVLALVAAAGHGAGALEHQHSVLLKD